MRLKSPTELTWDSVTSDLIQEDMTRSRKPYGGNDKQNFGRTVRGNTSSNNHERNTGSVNRPECTFCGMKGHNKGNCYINPNNPNCKMTDAAKKI